MILTPIHTKSAARKVYKRHPEYNWFVIKILTFQIGFPNHLGLFQGLRAVHN